MSGVRKHFWQIVVSGAEIGVFGGSGFYNQFRWGDYAATAPDLSKASSPLMWVAGDFDSSGSWATAIQAHTYAKPTDQ